MTQNVIDCKWLGAIEIYLLPCSTGHPIDNKSEAKIPTI